MAVRSCVPNEPLSPLLPTEEDAEILLPKKANGTGGDAQGGLETAPETEIIPIEVNVDHILREEATE